MTEYVTLLRKGELTVSDGLPRPRGEGGKNKKKKRRRRDDRDDSDERDHDDDDDDDSDEVDEEQELEDRYGSLITRLNDKSNALEVELTEAKRRIKKLTESGRQRDRRRGERELAGGDGDDLDLDDENSGGDGGKDRAADRSLRRKVGELRDLCDDKDAEIQRLEKDVKRLRERIAEREDELSLAVERADDAEARARRARSRRKNGGADNDDDDEEEEQEMERSTRRGKAGMSPADANAARAIKMQVRQLRSELPDMLRRSMEELGMQPGAGQQKSRSPRSARRSTPRGEYNLSYDDSNNAAVAAATEPALGPKALVALSRDDDARVRRLERDEQDIAERCSRMQRAAERAEDRIAGARDAATGKSNNGGDDDEDDELSARRSARKALRDAAAAAEDAATAVEDARSESTALASDVRKYLADLSQFRDALEQRAVAVARAQQQQQQQQRTRPPSAGSDASAGSRQQPQRPPKLGAHGRSRSTHGALSLSSSFYQAFALTLPAI